MKIAITSHGENRQAAIDTRFGRAAYFMLYDQDTDVWECLTNKQNLEATHGAGIQASQTITKAGANVLITGHVGPKAFKVLEAGQVKMYSVGDMNCTVEEALSAFLAGNLATITVPNPLDARK